MAIVLNTLVLDTLTVDTFADNNVRIGYHNILPTSAVGASSAATGYPASNLQTPVSYQKWKSNAVGTEQYITIQAASDETIDYFAVGAHNLGSTSASIRLQTITGSPALGSPQVWTDISVDTAINEDVVFINQFDEVTSQIFRLVITPSGSPGIAPEIGVLYVGKMTALPRKLYAGFSPPTLNRKTEVSSGYSENGQFLGRIRRNQYIDSSFSMDYISPNWYRVNLDPFVTACETSPFFFAWRPQEYPAETMLAWTTEDPTVENTGAPDFVKFSISMRGIR